MLNRIQGRRISGERCGPSVSVFDMCEARSPSLSAVESERDVLRHLLVATGGAIVLWDDELRLVWMSAGARKALPSERSSHELVSHAARAFNQLRQKNPAKRATSGSRVLAQLGSDSRKRLSVEFFCIETSAGCPWLVAELAPYRDVQGMLASLTRAEGEVLRLLIRGGSNREIAGELRVSTETVRTHVSRILSKLAVSSRAKATNLVRDVWSTRWLGQHRSRKGSEYAPAQSK